ncbi:MAG TPA: diacylglycerol kinase family protein [Bacteroidia bacterium]|jgi:diacylglycerol kinase|nr:diacylglycerol kinase family protein [Bacteroidia bacterium]
MSNPKYFTFRSRVKSVLYALQGVFTFFKTQTNAWIHLAAALVAVFLGFKFHINKSEWLAIVLVIALVFVTEMLNTALEFLTDLASPSVHPLAKKVKDVAAGAVLIAAIVSLVVAAFIFLPKIVCSYSCGM